jgi:hypothetical protein
MRYNGDRTVVAHTPFEIMRHAAQGLYDIYLYSMVAFSHRNPGRVTDDL